MSLFIPSWVKRHCHEFSSPEEIPQEVYAGIREKFSRCRPDQPIVSVVLIAFNEEKRILNSLSSLSELKSRYPFEVIVVNNNSTDRTQAILDLCGVKSVFQPIQGVGFAREAGLLAAKGKYHLCADADSIYPPMWIDEMIAPLERGEAICTYGKASILPVKSGSRPLLAVYELFKTMLVSIRSISRPELVAGGASLAFYTRMGKQIGWRTDIRRGTDAQMVLAMKRFGYIRMVRGTDSRIWTTAHTASSNAGLLLAFVKRMLRDMPRPQIFNTTARQNA